MRMRKSALVGAGLPLMFLAACSGGETLLGESDGADEGDARVDVDVDVDADADGPDVDDGPDVPVDADGDVDGAEIRPEADGRDAYPDPGPPDPWVPDSWDVPFEYMDIPLDYVPDAAGCGNGVVDPGEECDDGNTNDHDECTNACLFPRCGDGVVWHVLEDCDPPGSIRPCRTSCGTTGGEWCDSYCQWTGACVPPREVCGNGIDDDCDGVVDLIVRDTGNVLVSDLPIRDATAPSHVAWTGEEFAVEWESYLGAALLTRIDGWGTRLDWDAVLRDTTDGVFGIGWTGAFLGMMWRNDGPGSPASINNEYWLQAFDPRGMPASAPALLYSTVEGVGPCWSDPHPLMTASPDGYVVTCPSATDLTPLEHWARHYWFRHISPDGSTVSGELLLGDYLNVFTKCAAWTGSEYAMLLGDLASSGWYERRMDFILPAGVIRDSVVAAEPSPLPTVASCAWIGSRLAVLLLRSPFSLDIVAGDGGAVGSVDLSRSLPDVGTDSDVGTVVSTGTELGVIWSDDRSGNPEIYFTRASPDGVRLSDDARLTRTPYSSWAPSLAWTGDSWGAVWNDSDGVDLGTYFAHFSTCP